MALNIANFFDGPFFDGPFFDAGLVIGGGGSHPSQGYQGHEVRRRTKEDIRREREKFGVLPRQVEKIIERLAVKQAERLELDEQRQREQLAKELKAKRIAFEARYLEVLNEQRQALIDREIAYLFRARRRDEQDILALLAIAASVA